MFFGCQNQALSANKFMNGYIKLLSVTGYTRQQDLMTGYN